MLSGRIFAGYRDALEEAAGHPGVTELASGTPGSGPWGATPQLPPELLSAPLPP